MKPDLTPYLGRAVSVIVDRPLGSRHPRYPDLMYPVNYGFLPGTVSGDGREIDAYLLGIDVAVTEADAVIIAVVVRADDAEDKLVAAPPGRSYTSTQIGEAVAFQEQHFDSTVVLLSAEDTDAVAAWSLGPVLSASVPATGTVNRTVLLGFGTGARVLRVSTRGLERVKWEHQCIQFAADYGLPVCRPLAGPEGTIVERGGSCSALFPVADGEQIVREKMGPEHALAAGACLARIHAAFEMFPKEQARPKLLTGGILDTCEAIAHVEAAIESLPAQTETERGALVHLAGRRRHLERTPPDTAIAGRLAALPQRVLHGDYQETNLFFEGAEISAVIDWDQAGSGPRGWEILRALHLLCGLKPTLCAAFLRGYERVDRLEPGELEESAACYGLLADRNLWVYTSAYLESNERAKRFMSADEFVPFAALWAEATKKAGS